MDTTVPATNNAATLYAYFEALQMVLTAEIKNEQQLFHGAGERTTQAYSRGKLDGLIVAKRALDGILDGMGSKVIPPKIIQVALSEIEAGDRAVLILKDGAPILRYTFLTKPVYTPEGDWEADVVHASDGEPYTARWPDAGSIIRFTVERPE